MMHNKNYPNIFYRIGNVWFRHFKVYKKNLISNGLPPFFEPLIFLAGIGLGLSAYIPSMENMPYVKYLASGLLVTTAMYTAAFECSFGTFMRLESYKVYDSMLAAPITINNLLIGEILWAGTKGFFFSSCVLCIVSIFKILPLYLIFFAPFVGFLTGVMFGSLSLFVTSFVNDFNQFNFYFTGFLSPMFFFAGVVFPVKTLPSIIRPIAEIFPLTHSVRLVRSICFWNFSPALIWDLVFVIIFTVLTCFFAIKRLGKRIIN